MNTQMHLCRWSLARHCHCHKYTHPPSLTPTCSSQHNLLKGLLLCVVVMMLHCALQQYIYTRVCPDLACIHYTAIQLSQAKLLKRPLYTGAVRNPQHMVCIGNPVPSLKTKMERIELISHGPSTCTPVCHDLLQPASIITEELLPLSLPLIKYLYWPLIVQGRKSSA